MIKKPGIIFFCTGLLSFIIYVSTLAPTITWRNDGVDSGDLATAVAIGGVPHPPGYPTYLLVGEIFRFLPFGDVAYRLNLLSATSAALTVGNIGAVIYVTLLATVRQSEKQRATLWQQIMLLCAGIASLAMAFSATFWSQAVIAEVYTLNAFFASLLLLLALHIHPANQGWLLPLTIGLFGVSLGNHPSILFFLPMLVFGLKVRWQWRSVAIAGLAFFVGLLIYLLIPWRAATLPALNWGLATTWPNFLWLLSAEPYRQFVFALPWQFVPQRILIELSLFAGGFLWWGLPVGGVGLQQLFRCQPNLAYRSSVSFLLISSYAVGYNTTDSYVYLLPAFLIFTLWVGWGLFHLSQILPPYLKLSPKQSPLMMGTLMLLPILSLLLNFSEQNISRDEAALSFARRSLQVVHPDAVILSDNDPHTFALWYGRYGLGLRPDVAIVNSNLLPYAWYRQSLQITHENLRLLDDTGHSLKSLPAFLEQNLSATPIYFATLESPLTLEVYSLEKLADLPLFRVATPR